MVTGYAPAVQPTSIARAEEYKRRYIDAIYDHGNYSAAARAIGIDYATTWRYRQEDPAFAQACEQARMDARSRVESAMYHNALGADHGGTGKGNFLDRIAWLKANDPEGKYRDNVAIDVHHSGVIGTIALDRLPPEQLQATLQLAAQRYLTAPATTDIPPTDE